LEKSDGVAANNSLYDKFDFELLIPNVLESALSSRSRVGTKYKTERIEKN
jgi:hypothetical protein